MEFFNYMKNEIIRCECVDMSVEGMGIARADELVVFVKGLIKGEIADVKIIAEKKNYAIAIIDKLIKSSPHRREPDCKIAYKCGGCDYRHIDYDYQLQLKKEVLENTFKNYTVTDVLKADDPFYYRNKVQIPIKNHKMGFYRKYSNDIVEFDDCYLESKTANLVFKELKDYLLTHNLDKNIRHILIKHAMGTDEVMVALIVNSFEDDYSKLVSYITNKFEQIRSFILNLNDKKTNVILGDEEKVLNGKDHIIDEFDGIKVKISLKSFYQVNRNQMLKLYGLIKELSEVKNTDGVLDLYCGIGTISLYMARFAKKVHGVEIVKEAVENAKDNAKLNNIDNAEFVLADASKDMDQYLINKDLVIVDPPRKGISRELISSLIKNNIPKIVYVSCNPATLARDLELLKEYYDISDIHPVDMFPFTVHTECVVALNRK